MIEKGDRVEVTFSDKHVEIGQVKDITDSDSYNYIVTIKVFGKDTDVYCCEESLKVV